MLIFQQPHTPAITLVTKLLTDAGFQVIHTFDLQSACGDEQNAICPHHGTAPCTCQLTILFVYEPDYQPIGLMLHSYANQTTLAVVDTPQQRANPQLEMKVMKTISSNTWIASVAL